jgi:hypothetical protein
MRVKEYERERRLLMRKRRKELASAKQAPQQIETAAA